MPEFVRLTHKPPSSKLRGYRIVAVTRTFFVKELTKGYPTFSSALETVRLYKNPNIFAVVEIWYSGDCLYQWRCTQKEEYYNMSSLRDLAQKKAALDKEDTVPFLDAVLKKVVLDNGYGFLLTGIREGNSRYGPCYYYDIMMLQTAAYKGACGFMPALAGNKARFTITFKDSTYRKEQVAVLKEEFVGKARPMKLVTDSDNEKQVDVDEWEGPAESQDFAPTVNTSPLPSVLYQSQGVAQVPGSINHNTLVQYSQGGRIENKTEFDPFLDSDELP